MGPIFIPIAALGPLANVYIYDLNKLRDIYQTWSNLLGKVTPHYAVKCNPNLELVRTLAALGCSFDCASPAEIDEVLKLNVEPQKIIYANPCKKPEDIRYAARRNVRLTTFDSICELEKIQKAAPDTKLVLRIYANDPTAQCVLSNKYGALEYEWEPILDRAQELGATVVGVSFHIGSGACNPSAFTEAIQNARRVYDLASLRGYKLELLDIGGGFTLSNLEEMAGAINEALDASFPDDLGVRFISEPGRLFAETIATLITKVIGVRKRGDTHEVIMTDSTYGSFNCIVNDHARPTPCVYNGPTETVKTVKTKIFMETCDGGDLFQYTFDLPELKYGDSIVWPNMGAYTSAACTRFNGMNFTKPCIFYVGKIDG